MPIKNYTTSVSVDKTIIDLQKILVKANARSIHTQYENGQPSALMFQINVGGSDVMFKLPVVVAGVTASLKKSGKHIKEDQARRVAWRIVKDWCDSQMALIDAGQAELAQVFLPYAQAANGETFYQVMKSKGFLQLSGPKS